MKHLFIVNSSMIPNDGTYSMYSVDTTDKVGMTAMLAMISDLRLSGHYVIQSAIGHDSTAKVASAILDMEVPVNRIIISMSVEDRAICIKPKVRLEEGKVLTLDELLATPCTLSMITRVE